MKKILVVGGAGYLGSHMVKMLLAAGRSVVTVDDFSTGHRNAIAGGEIVEGSIGDPALLRQVLSAHRFDGVMHFASCLQVGESVSAPAKYYLNNVANTLILAGAMVESGARALALQVASGRRSALQVFGRDYDTSDGTCVRDYVHVNDLCQAHLLAMNRLCDDADAAVYNLGNGVGFSVQQVIQAAKRVTGKPIRVQDGPRRPGDPAVLLADSQRARAELAWAPEFSDLETIIEHAWRWEQKVSKDGFAA